MVVLLCNYSYGPSRGSSCSTQLYRGSRKLHHQAHRTISRSTSRKHETSCLLLLLHTRRRPLRVGTYSVGRCGRQQCNAVVRAVWSCWELNGPQRPVTLYYFHFKFWSSPCVEFKRLPNQHITFSKRCKTHTFQPRQRSFFDHARLFFSYFPSFFCRY